MGRSRSLTNIQKTALEEAVKAAAGRTSPFSWETNSKQYTPAEAARAVAEAYKEALQIIDDAG